MGARDDSTLICCWACFCALVAAAPAWPGTIEVHVHARDGSSVRNAGVWIMPIDATAWEGYRRQYGTSDSSGATVFEHIAPGSYDVGLAHDGSMDFVAPERNPFVPPPRVTLLEPDEGARVDLELWHGSRVSLSFSIDRGPIPRRQLSFIHRETGTRYEGLTDEGGHYETLLVPGDWRVTIDPPPGHLLVDLDVDGQSVPGTEAHLDLEELGTTRYVAWRYIAPATIWGRVTVASGDGRPAIVARLLEPGPWIEAARARGVPPIDSVRGKYITPDVYQMTVPDGKWEVVATDADLEESDPERVELQLDSGDSGRADFKVRMRSSEAREPLIVTPRAEDQPIIRGVHVEVWSVAEDGAPLERLAQEFYEWRPVLFRNLEAGDYLVVAGHSEYLEGRAIVRGYDPEANEPKMVAVTLPVGARLEVRALDDEDRTVPEVELYLERMSAPPDLLIEDEEFRRAKQRPVTRTDSSGFGSIKSVYPGTYVARARTLGERASIRFVRIDGHSPITRSEAPKFGAPVPAYTPPAALDEPVEELEITIDQGVSLGLRVLPAASFRISLECDDGGPLTDSAEARVFAVGSPHLPRREDPDLLAGALLDRDGFPLLGVLYDTFTIGPLESGASQLAVRPSGNGLWTWAYGAERREEAANFLTEIGDTVKVGQMQVACAPVVELWPRIGDGQAPPDMRLTKVTAVVRPKQKKTQSKPRTYRPRVEKEMDAILLRDLEPGLAELEVTMTHPHFLPQATLSWTFKLELERGRLQTHRPEVPAVGGALRVVADHPAVRATWEDAEPLVVATESGQAEIPSLPPGTYQVDACATVDCSKILRSWKAVPVERAQTQRLP